MNPKTKKLKKLPFKKYRGYRGVAMAVQFGAPCIVLAESKEDLVEIWAEMEMEKPIVLERCHPSTLVVDTPLAK